LYTYNLIQVPPGTRQTCSMLYLNTRRHAIFEDVFKVSMLSKRKLPEGVAVVIPITGKSTVTSDSPPTADALETQISPIRECKHANIELETPSTPMRDFKPGCPASDFLNTMSPTQYKPVHVENILRCNLSETPKVQWSKRFNLPAIIISVQPIIKTEMAIRRYVVCRDSSGECIVCLWNSHSSIITEDSVGRPVLFSGVTIGELDGAPTLKLPKSASISIGDRMETREVKEWFRTQGVEVLDVCTAEKGFTGPQIISVKGMLGKIVEQSIITQSGATRNLITLHIAGAPNSRIAIQFWSSSNDKTEAQILEAMLHKPVVITKMRAYIDIMRGSTFESISTVTKVTRTHDEELQTWWFTPKPNGS